MRSGDFYETHRRGQRRAIREGTTPLQRLEWLEEMLELFGPHIVAARARAEKREVGRSENEREA